LISASIIPANKEVRHQDPSADEPSLTRGSGQRKPTIEGKKGRAA